MSHYLVTGGAGFIGSHLCEELLRRGHQVRVADDLSTGKRGNLQKGVEFVEGDLADLATARRVVEGCHYVLHQAAIPSVPRSVKDPLTSHRANVDATVNMLIAARDAGVKRLVFAGSSSAYGDTPTLPKREDMPNGPLSPYALQKVIGEQYLQMFTKLYGLETVTIRYFNVFGPRQDPASEYAAVIPRFITAALAGKGVTVFGDGTQSRDFCFIDNTVEANLAAASAPASAVSGGVFNVACGAATSLNDVVKLVADIVGHTVPIAYAQGRVGDVKHSLADITAARERLGYRGAISFAEGLKRTAAWYAEKH